MPYISVRSWPSNQSVFDSSLGNIQSALVKIKYVAFVCVTGYSRAIFHHQVSYLTLFVLC